MTDLERLFRRLVDNLIAIDPARLHRPLALDDLLESVIPYRTTRRALAIDSAEDYDTLVLRLCAGEGGFIHMVSEDVGQVFRDQLAGPNPDLDVLREHAKAELVLGTEPLAHALGPGPEEAFAPPEEDLVDPPPPPASSPAAPHPTAPTREPVAEGRVRIPFLDETTPPPAPMVPPPPRITAEPEPGDGPSSPRQRGPRCGYCGGALPNGRTVNFCPHCGQNQSLTRCPECQADLELGWKHCINCGHFVGEG
jgi:Double zinc ribbon